MTTSIGFIFLIRAVLADAGKPASAAMWKSKTRREETVVL